VPATTTDRPALRRLLESDRCPEGTLTYDALHGFLFAVLNGPEVIPPSEWIPEIFAGGEPVYDSPEQLQAVIDELMAVHNEVVAELEPGALPPGVRFVDPTVANLDAGAPLSRWSRGFLQGYGWIEESWIHALPAEMEAEWSSVVTTLAFFASPSFADGIARDSGKDVAAVAETVRQLFQAAAAEYIEVGRLVEESVADTAGAPAVSTKIGRNEPCPCGSGRKFKKCCGAPSAIR
jgi:uncharacterized protein